MTNPFLEWILKGAPDVDVGENAAVGEMKPDTALGQVMGDAEYEDYRASELNRLAIENAALKAENAELIEQRRTAFCADLVPRSEFEELRAHNETLARVVEVLRCKLWNTHHEPELSGQRQDAIPAPAVTQDRPVPATAAPAFPARALAYSR